MEYVGADMWVALWLILEARELLLHHNLAKRALRKE
jgi:hypothetical protein